MQDTLRLTLSGAFSLIAPDGSNRAPRASKGCALLALLATGEAGKRSRAWLQEKLWSDRGRDQAGASLRQALTQIKRHLGDYADILTADRNWVQLDLGMVDVVRDGRGEFLEGLEIRDPAFAEWLEFERTNDAASNELEAVSARPERMRAERLERQDVIVIQTRPDRDSPLGWAERLVADVMLRSLAEEFCLPVMQSDHVAEDMAGWLVTVDGANPAKGEFALRAVLVDVNSQRQVWSSFRIVRGGTQIAHDQPEILKLTHELAESIAEHVVLARMQADSCEDPDALCRLGMRRLFTLRPEMVRSADDLFAKAYRLQPRGVYLAWRAQVREVQKLERLRNDFDALREESDVLTRQALEREPGNSMVQALLANSSLYVSGDAHGSLGFAKRAVQINPGNPMGWWALSAARMFLNEAQESYKAAQFARYLTQRSQFAFWAEGQLAGAALALGKLDEAKALFKSAAASCSHYRPALRHLVALHAQDGEWEQAREAIAALQRIEPSFSPDQMVADASYPVSLLRKSNDLDIGRVRVLV